MPVQVRRSKERGHADHGWLDTSHTFSFASYFDSKFQNFGAFRVLNEDHVTGGNGFDTHPHSNYEIFSYIVQGAIHHKDSAGHDEVIERDGVQFTTAGSGLSHSEYNNSESEDLHFLQMWVKPAKMNLKPGYQTGVWADEDKLNHLTLLIRPEEDESRDEASKGQTPIKIHQDAFVYASVLEEGKSLQHAPSNENRRVYIHVIEGKDVGVTVNDDIELKGGDGAFITEEAKITLTGTGSTPTEFVLLELA